MLTLISGLLIAAGGVYGVMETYKLAFLLLYVIGLGVVVVPTFQPLSGWEYCKCLNQYDLIPLIPNSECYVVQDRDGNLMYKFKDENGNEIIKHSTFVDTIYDNENVSDKPVLKEVQLKAKKSLWSLPIFCSKKEQYVIKIPPDKLQTAILK